MCMTDYDYDYDCMTKAGKQTKKAINFCKYPKIKISWKLLNMSKTIWIFV